MEQENFTQPQNFQTTPTQEPTKVGGKKMYLILLLTCAVLVTGYFVSAYYFTFWPFSAKTNNVINEETNRLAGWENYKYENYGLQFQLPEGWQQIESETPDEGLTRTLTFTPKSAEYGTRPYNQQLLIIVRDNPNKLPYEKLIGLEDRPDLVEDYYKGESVLVGGKSAIIVYEQVYPEMNFKTDPLVTVQLDNQFIDIIWPRENDDYSMFQTFLTTFKFFEPIKNVTNTSKVVKQTLVANLSEWCAKAPTPGQCYSELARKEKNPDISWCTAITPQNSGSEPFYYSYKNECYEYIAPKIKDISLCDNMVGSGQFEANKTNDTKNCKARVNYELALQGSDISYCNKIDKDVIKANAKITIINHCNLKVVSVFIIN